MIRSALILILVSSTARAASPVREPVAFGTNWAVSVGTSVFVVGNHEDVGSWNPALAKKLVFDGGSWTGRVAVQAGTSLEYKYIARLDAANQLCEATNVTWEPGANRTYAVPAQPTAPYAGKTVFYYSSWSQVFLLHSTNGTDFVDVAMAAAGPGRTAGETLYRVDGIGAPGGSLQFVLHDGAGNYDHAPYPGFGSPGPDYFTELDVFLVQDGSVYTEWPSASVSASRRETHTVASSVPGFPTRPMRVYLPAGYDDHPQKRYPVLYMHDGQNIYNPPEPGAFGSWLANDVADREISQGRMRACIIVGIDHGVAERIPEYLPPTDSFSGTTGRSDLYLQYVLQDVRPFVNSSYRTLTGRDDTVVLGSSMGGIASVYFGWEAGDVFGKIGCFSSAVYTAPNYMAGVNAGTKQDLRIYLDAGTAEGSSIWSGTVALYNTLLRLGHAENLDLLTRFGCGQGHNEAAWASRLPAALQFLLNPRDEPNRLAQETFPPRIEGYQIDRGSQDVMVQFAGLGGHRYVMERAEQLSASNWMGAVTGETIVLPWQIESMIHSNSVHIGAGFVRVRAIPGQ